MEMHIKVPDQIDNIVKLKVGDILYVTGKVFTARDEAHVHMLELAEKKENIAFDPSKMVMYHCGPIVKKDPEWKVVSAGPTTSARMDLFEKEFMEHYKTRIFVGKGGMGERTAEALKRIKGIYATYTGGAGALAAVSFKKVENVYWLEELGAPEAVWILDAVEFGPLIVSIDSNGDNWNAIMRKKTDQKKAEIFKIIDSQ